MDEARKVVIGGGQLDLSPPGEFHPQEHSDRMEPTSVGAYERIKDEGLLSKMRLKVYVCLLERGPCTGAEVDAHLTPAGGRGHYHKRLAELARLGVVETECVRTCKVTGRSAWTWRVIPGAIPRAPGRTDALSKPSRKDLAESLTRMRTWYRAELSYGTAPPESFVRTMRWLASLVGPRCGTCQGTGQSTTLDGHGDSCPDCDGRGVAR